MKKLKILYGVPGEGMGHATRTKVIVEYLAKTHDIRIVTSDRAYVFLKKCYPKLTYEIKGFHFGFKKGEVSKVETVKLNLKTAPKNIKVNFKKYNELHKGFKADVVISDFESFSYFFAKLHRLPLLSIDNIQILNRGKIDIKIPKEEKVNFNLAKAIVKAKVPKSDHYLISTFFDVEIIKKNTELIQPIVRQEIIDAKVSTTDHILVYQSSSGQNDILNILKNIPNEKFYLYGFNREESHGNVQMKKFSETEFIKYFSTAKAVLANGGYSFISEALFLKKPICSVPIQNQFEQYMNGAYLQKMKYGKLLKRFSEDGIKAFLYDIPMYQKQLKGYNQKNNSKLFKKIDEVLNNLI